MSGARLARVAVLGCGYWGKNLVRNFAELGALAAVCDVDAGLADQMSSTFGAPARTFDEILADGSIPAMAIAAPAELHYRLAYRALGADKHVFVEKPLSLELAEALELCRMAAQTGRTLMVGHLLQYHPVFLRLKALASDGTLGRIRYLYSNRLNLGKVRREENILWSFAPHDISMILALVGSEPESVQAQGAAYLHKVIADTTTTHLRFAGGENAHIFVSWLHPYKEQKLVMVGEDAMAVFDDGEPWESKLTIYRHRIDWIDGQPRPRKAEAEPVPVEAEEPLRLECRHFLDCVATGATPRTDGAEGARVLRVLQAAQRSLDSEGRAVTLGEIDRSARFAGAFVHESAYVDEPATIGAGTKIWHFSHVLPHVEIGTDCVIGQNVVVGPRVSIGNRCKIQNNVSVYSGVTLEDGVFCGPSCVFTNVSNPRAEIERKDEFRPTLVRRGATIGANATIVCGHTIGRHAFVAAGAVVADDVPDYALVAGVPAKRIGWMSAAGGRLDHDLVCPIDGSRYRLTGPDRLEPVTP